MNSLNIDFNSLKKSKNIKDISSCISLELLEKFSYKILLCWIFSPILLFIINLICDFFTLSSIWLTIFYLLGFCSFINFILYRYKVSLKRCKLILLFLFLYIIWAFISCFFSSDIILSLFGNSYRQEGFFVYLCYVFLFFNSMIMVNSKYKENLFKYFSFVSFIMSVLVLLSYYLNLDFNFTRTFTSIFFNENHSAYYFMMGYVCIILMFIFCKTKKKNILYLILSTVILHNLILNDTLGCYLTLLVFFVVLFVYILIIKKYVKKFLIIIVTFSLVSIFNYKIVFTNFNLFFDDIIVVTDSSSKEENVEIFYEAGSSRIGLWINALNFIVEKPIFGYGIENLYDRYKDSYVTHLTSRPHNEYIQIGAFMGIPALVFYLCFLCSIYFPILLKIKKVDNCVVISILIAFSYLVSAFFGVSMYYTTPYLFIFLGMTSSYFIENKE